MVDCRYCERSFTEEGTLREHLYETHDREELSRIDRKRVEQYVDEHGLDESDINADTDDNQSSQHEQQTVDTSDGEDHADRWERSDVEALSTDDIVDKLTNHGIETNETAFRNRAKNLNSATTLSEQWEADYEVAATGFDQDFIWMAAQELWKRWASEVPNKERIYDFVQEGRDLRENGDRVEACDRWLTAWEYILAVIPDDSTTIEEADQTTPTFLSVEAFIRSLDSDLATVAEDDPTYHEHRLEFCREVCETFPDANDELLLDFRHFVADSLNELNRTADSRTEFELLIEEYPEDPWAYKKLADSYWLEESDELSIETVERTADLYRTALDIDKPLEGASMVADRLEKVERRLTDAKGADHHGAEKS